MKKLLLTLLISLPTLSYPQKNFDTNLNLTCNTLNILLKEITETYKEIPTWIGNNNDKIQTITFTNPKTTTWTTIITDGNFACVLGNGQNFSIKLPNNIPKTPL